MLDLNIRFGGPPDRYRPENSLVILQHAGRAFGMIVDAVLNVRSFTAEERLPWPAFGIDLPLDVRLLTGLVKVGERVVMLLDPVNLLHLALSAEEQAANEIGAETVGERTKRFCPEATPQERAAFRERAFQLAQIPESRTEANTHSLVVLRLGGEYFGVALQSIREFTEARAITPVPCCPAHIRGLMNLRGDLITLVDIAGMLGVPASTGQAERKVVVPDHLDLNAGVLVDEILDTFTLPIAAQTGAHAIPQMPGREYLQGIVPYGARMLRLLDLNALLTQQNLIVNETP